MDLSAPGIRRKNEKNLLFLRPRDAAAHVKWNKPNHMENVLSALVRRHAETRRRRQQHVRFNQDWPLAAEASLALKRLRGRKGPPDEMPMFFPSGQLYSMIAIPYVSVVSDSLQGTAHVPIHSVLTVQVREVPSASPCT